MEFSDTLQPRTAKSRKVEHLVNHLCGHALILLLRGVQSRTKLALNSSNGEHFSVNPSNLYHRTQDNEFVFQFQTKKNKNEFSIIYTLINQNFFQRILLRPHVYGMLSISFPLRTIWYDPLLWCVVIYENKQCIQFTLPRYLCYCTYWELCQFTYNLFDDNKLKWTINTALTF